MDMSILLKINARVKLKSESNNIIEFLVDDTQKIIFNANHPALTQILLHIFECGINISHLEAIDNQSFDGKRLNLFILQMKNHFCVEYHVNLGIERGGHSFVVRPLNSNFYIPLDLPIHENSYELSCYSYIHQFNSSVFLRNPLASCDITMTYESLAILLSALGKSTVLPALLMTLENSNSTKYFFHLLIKNNFINPKSSCLQSNIWEFHDLLFHFQSRLHESDTHCTFGSTNRKLDRLCKITGEQNEASKYICLPPPSIRIEPVTAQFLKVLQNRRSKRNFDQNQPINIQQTSDFLWYSLGDCAKDPTDANQCEFRPYPSAGGVHDLEFYLVVRNCPFLTDDIYLYKSEIHALQPLFTEKNAIIELLTNANYAIGKKPTDLLPQILIVATSKFEKMARQYRRMAYRSTLIGVGAVFQTMHLVATALDLAACVIGWGNSRTFANAIGADSLKEVAVGEFIIGTACKNHHNDPMKGTPLQN